jgi:hypothetical protein
LTVLLIVRTQDIAHADAKLLGFDEPTRVPDAYKVVLKESLAWHHKLDDRPVHSDDPVLDRANAAAPDKALQEDAQPLDKVAGELAAAYHGAPGAQFHAVLRGFTIKMSERDVGGMAKDPRIESITANHIIGSVWDYP